MHDRTSAAPTHPEAEYVGPHLIIDKTEWVPGGHPEPHLREDGQTTYPERYLRCLRCEAERLHRDEFPAECDADVTIEARPDVEARPEVDVPGVSDGRPLLRRAPPRPSPARRPSARPSNDSPCSLLPHSEGFGGPTY